MFLYFINFDLFQGGQGLLGNNFGQGGEKTVLRVIIDHMIYPVTLDVLQQIFSRAGQVLKIVTFTKLNTFQALIQFADADTAHQAKMNLSGQNIYNGRCLQGMDPAGYFWSRELFIILLSFCYATLHHIALNFSSLGINK